MDIDQASEEAHEHSRSGPALFAKEHSPGALNMDWRQVLAKRHTIPKNQPVLIHWC